MGTGTLAAGACFDRREFNEGRRTWAGGDEGCAQLLVRKFWCLLLRNPLVILSRRAACLKFTAMANQASTVRRRLCDVDEKDNFKIFSSLNLKKFKYSTVRDK